MDEVNMKFISSIMTDRTEVSVGDEFRFVRMKTYNSYSGQTKIIWKDKSDLSIVCDEFHEELERLYLRNKRNKSIIVNKC